MPSRKQKRSRKDEDAGTQPAGKKKRGEPSMFDSRPKVGMRIDARDVDYIWSCGTIVKVKHNNTVTVHFDGWTKSTDETLPWNSTKIAPLYSFTKCVKCLVQVFSKQRGASPTKADLEALPAVAPQVYSYLWPCKVQFRMPHPMIEGKDDTDCMDAQAFLASEKNIFVQPYATNLLPHHVKHLLKLDKENGAWLSAKRVYPWKSNPLEYGVPPENFGKAFRIAKGDKTTVGVLPSGAINKGTLLKEEYLVHSRDGVEVKDGALHKEQVEIKQSSKGKVEKKDEVVVKTSAGDKTTTGAATQQEEEQSWQSRCVIS